MSTSDFFLLASMIYGARAIESRTFAAVMQIVLVIIAIFFMFWSHK